MADFNWTKINSNLERIERKLETLTQTPAKDRTPAQRGQISQLVKEKVALKVKRQERRVRWLEHLARIGLDA
jgi:hypothetical protein